MIKTLKTTKTTQNREIKLLGKAKSKPILVIGAFHGDEPQGNFLINNYLKNNSESNLLFIPCLNPDGMSLNTRQNANGVDLNRNFPTKNWELTENKEFFGGNSPSSELETQFIVEVIKEYSPKFILTLHAPFCSVNFDGNALKQAQEISKIINYPVQEDIGYPTPGSFGTYAGIERKIPTITLELDEKTDVKNLIEPVEKIFKYLEDFMV